MPSVGKRSPPYGCRGRREREEKGRQRKRSNAREEGTAPARRRKQHFWEALFTAHWRSVTVQYFFGAREGKRAKTLYHISMIVSITLTYMYSPSSIRLALKFRRGLSRCRGWPSERRPQRCLSSWRSWRPRGRPSRDETPVCQHEDHVCSLC